jgi:uncharacterized membrane protein
VKATKAAPVPLSGSPARAPRQGPNRWWVPTGLIVLNLIPVLGGAFRLTELTGGADITPRNERFFDSPAPVLIHIVSTTVYAFLGAFQFLPSLRRPKKGKKGWHQVMGRILIPAGFLVALSGLWMTLFYALPPSDGVILYILRLIFGTAMLAFLILGVLDIKRRNFTGHGAWMTRAYAIAVGAGTQPLLLMIPELTSGPPDVTTRAVLMGAAWIINLSVAEYAIHRRRGGPSTPAQRSQNKTRVPDQRTA